MLKLINRYVRRIGGIWENDAGRCMLIDADRRTLINRYTKTDDPHVD